MSEETPDEPTLEERVAQLEEIIVALANRLDMVGSAVAQLGAYIEMQSQKSELTLPPQGLTLP